MQPIDPAPVPDAPPAPLGVSTITSDNFADTAKDVLERALATGVIAVLTFWTTSGALNFTLTEAAATSGIVAFLTVVFTFIRQSTVQSFSNPYVDIMVRMGWTFLQVSGGLIVAASFDWGDFNSWTAAGSAGLASAFSLLKGWLAERFVSGTITPASMFKATKDQFARA